MKFKDILKEDKRVKNKYSISFEIRKSLGSYDRKLDIKKKNLTIAQINSLLKKYR